MKRPTHEKQSHDCPRMSGSTIRLCALAARRASVCSQLHTVRYLREARVCVCSHAPRYGIYTPLPPRNSRRLNITPPQDHAASRSRCVNITPRQHHAASTSRRLTQPYM
eukprot:61563-Prymnesium_polylepis.1